MPKWTEEEKQWLAENYATASHDELVNHLDRNIICINKYAHEHGISKGRYWTPEERDYMERNVGKMPLKKIAENLGKTYTAVKDRNTREGYGKYIDNVDGIYLTEVSRLVGRDRETIKDVWVKRGLKIRKRGKYSIIKESCLAEVMRNNPDIWDATNCEKWFFERYAWFRQKREVDFKKMVDKRWKGVM